MCGRDVIGIGVDFIFVLMCGVWMDATARTRSFIVDFRFILEVN